MVRSLVAMPLCARSRLVNGVALVISCCTSVYSKKTLQHERYSRKTLQHERQYCYACLISVGFAETVGREIGGRGDNTEGRSPTNPKKVWVRKDQVAWTLSIINF